MPFTNFVVLMIVVLVACSVNAAKSTTTTTETPPKDCATLKVCLQKVAAKKGCGCSKELQSQLEQFNDCLKRNDVVDKCAENRANYVCYNCDKAAAKCFIGFPQETTDAEEPKVKQCEDELKKAFKSKG